MNNTNSKNQEIKSLLFQMFWSPQFAFVLLLICLCSFIFVSSRGGRYSILANMCITILWGAIFICRLLNVLVQKNSVDTDSTGNHALESAFAVERWNAAIAVGADVTYEKSELEGRVILKTIARAYVLGDEAVVELEHIGLCKLSKTRRFLG